MVSFGALAQGLGPCVAFTRRVASPRQRLAAEER